MRIQFNSIRSTLLKNSLTSAFSKNLHQFKSFNGLVLNKPSFFSTSFAKYSLAEVKPELAQKEETKDGHEAVIKKMEKKRARFWKAASLQETEEGYKVLLDARALKTASGKALSIPKDRPTFAHLVAAEWETQDKVLKPHALPLTSLASRAIDDLGTDASREETVSLLLKYLDTDSVCYHQEFPETILKLQKLHFDPLVHWVEREFGVKLATTSSIIGRRQPQEVTLALKNAALKFDPLMLAGFERATIAAKSFVIALALMHRRISVEEAAQASHVEVQFQISQWGEVEDTHDVDHQDIRRLLGSSLATGM